MAALLKFALALTAAFGMGVLAAVVVWQDDPLATARGATIKPGHVRMPY